MSMSSLYCHRSGCSACRTAARQNRDAAPSCAFGIDSISEAQFRGFASVADRRRVEEHVADARIFLADLSRDPADRMARALERIVGVKMDLHGQHHVLRAEIHCGELADGLHGRVARDEAAQSLRR